MWYVRAHARVYVCFQASALLLSGRKMKATARCVSADVTHIYGASRCLVVSFCIVVVVVRLC